MRQDSTSAEVCKALNHGEFIMTKSSLTSHLYEEDRHEGHKRNLQKNCSNSQAIKLSNEMARMSFSENAG